MTRVGGFSLPQAEARRIYSAALWRGLPACIASCAFLQQLTEITGYLPGPGLRCVRILRGNRGETRPLRGFSSMNQGQGFCWFCVADADSEVRAAGRGLANRLAVR